MKVLTTTVARILYAFPFAIFGINHFMKASMMKGYVPSWVPFGIFWVYLIGLILIATSVAIIIGKYVRISSLALAVLLLLFILTIHIPGLMDSATMQMSLPNLLKDTALLGGALLLAGIYDGEGSTS